MGLIGDRKTEPDRVIRFAVIGQGHFSQSAVLPAFDAADNCELVALFSDDATKLDELKEMYEVQHALGYDQYDEFLRSGAVDAVYIVLPNDMHCDFTLRAAAAGVHVLCEKPMAVSSEEGERMIAACDQAGVKLMVAYRLHFEEANMSTVELLHGGKLGEPRYFAETINNDETPEPSGTEGLADLRVIEAIQQSTATGAPVPVKAVAKSERPSLQHEREEPAHGKPEMVNVQSPSR